MRITLGLRLEADQMGGGHCLPSCQGLTAVSISNSNYFDTDHWNCLTASFFCWLLTGFTLLSANKLSSKQI